jgi:hypothetical protein
MRLRGKRNASEDSGYEGSRCTDEVFHAAFFLYGPRFATGAS